MELAISIAFMCASVTYLYSAIGATGVKRGAYCACVVLYLSASIIWLFMFMK